MSSIETRKAWMSVLAKAPADRVIEACSSLPDTAYNWVRPPEIGGVMVRGRAGGTGAKFNIGEMTVTRCALRLASGETGHAYVQGRNKDHATCAALVDALMQTDQAGDIEARVLVPLQAQAARKRQERAAKAGATKVDFFTMVRGDN